MELVVLAHESRKTSHKLFGQCIAKGEPKLKVNRDEKDINGVFML